MPFGFNVVNSLMIIIFHTLLNTMKTFCKYEDFRVFHEIPKNYESELILVYVYLHSALISVLFDNNS